MLGIIAKGINALLELVGAVLVWSVNPSFLKRVVRVLTQQELIEDPRDFFATHLVQFAANFSLDGRSFIVLYLLIHGGVKLFLIIALWRRKLWAYPAAISVFALFGVYQLYRYTISQNVGLIVLTALDVVVIALTVVEYKNVRRHGIS